MDHIQYCDALSDEVVLFADVMSSVPLDVDVPSCPGWTVLDVADHLGGIHRWAEELVRRRSTTRIAREDSPELREFVTPDWIRQGGATLVATLLAADPDDEMWAWGADKHVRFWSRRQLHETLVHRMDLELAVQESPQADADIAADAIDEFLFNLENVARRARSLAVLRGHGEKLAFRVLDSETLWSVNFEESGFGISKVESAFDAELIGTPVDLLLVLLRRRSVALGSVEVKGDRKLLDFWLEHSAFD